MSRSAMLFYSCCVEKLKEISEVLMKLSASRYCTMNCLMSLEDQTCWVIFIVKVSRIPSQSQYIGFQGGEYDMDDDHIAMQLFADCIIHEVCQD